MKQGAIGFDRRLKREWLEATAALAASGAGLPSIRCQLDDLLAAFLAESGERGARSKTITVLCRIWATPQRETDGLRAGRIEMAPFRQLLQSPALFPSSMDACLTQIRENPRLELGRQGLDEDTIIVRPGGGGGRG